MTEEDTSAEDEQDTNSPGTTATTPSTYKVRGKLSDQGATGVFGYNDASSGSSRGVYGRVDSGDNDAAGVRGVAASGTVPDAADGVVGITEDTGDSNNGEIAAGVRGEATNESSLETAGVYGRANGISNEPSGVLGVADNSTALKSYGVVGRTVAQGDDAAGVRGEATNGSGQNYGVEGTTASTDTDAAGVRGAANASNGTVHGVYGTTNSSSGYGVYSDDDAMVNGNHEVTGNVSATNVTTSADINAGDDLTATDNLSIGGYQEVGELGSSVYLEVANNEGYEVSSNSLTVVPYNVEVYDDGNEFSVEENEHWHQAQTDGKYHVTANVQWVDPFSDPDSYDVIITVTDIEGTEQAVAALPGQESRSASISKTIVVEEEERIRVRVKQDTSGPKYLENGKTANFLTVDKIG